MTLSSVGLSFIGLVESVSSQDPRNVNIKQLLEGYEFLFVLESKLCCLVDVHMAACIHFLQKVVLF